MAGKKGMYAYGASRIFWSFIFGFLAGAVVTYLSFKGVINIPFLK